MTTPTLADLHNPTGVTALNVRGDLVEADTDQAFQEYPGSWELWQMVEGRLLRVRRWLKKSVVATYAEGKATP